MHYLVVDSRENLKTMQDKWKQDVSDLIAQIPEDLGSGPQDEEKRQQAITSVRNLIATRWIALRTIATQWHAEDRDMALDATRECIQNLILLHGDHLEFGPDGDYFVPVPGMTSEAVRQQQADMVVDDSESKSSGSSTVPHSWMFLQTGGDVWTCLQALASNKESSKHEFL